MKSILNAPHVVAAWRLIESAIVTKSIRRLAIQSSAPVLIALGLISSMPANAQVSFAGAQTALPTTGLTSPNGVALDSSGNVYVADPATSAVKELVAAGGYTTVKTLGSGFSHPQGVAVDSSGNVYVADSDNSAVKEILAAGGYTTVNTLGSKFIDPYGVAVDSSGNVFVADSGNNAVKEILAAGGYTTVLTLGSGFQNPTGVAVDTNDNVFVADTENAAVKEILATGGYTTVLTLGSGFQNPAGVAVDNNDNVFVADFSFNSVKEIVAAGGYTTVNSLGSGFSFPSGVAVDQSGDVFVADPGHGRVVEVQTISVNFGSINIGSSTSLRLNYNIASTETLGTPNVLTLGAPNLDFTLAGGSTCTGSLTGGSSCTVDVLFSPRFAGPRNGGVQILDGSGNVLATTFIHGIGVGPQVAFANTTSGVYLPSVQSMLAAGFTQPVGIAVDGSGNVFVADVGSNDVYEILATGGYSTIKTLATGFLIPIGLAVDGLGNVFVADTYNSQVKEIVAAGGYTTVRTLGGSFGAPYGVAVDGNGNVFVADSVDSQLTEILAASGYTTTQTFGQYFDELYGLALDGSGNVFVSDSLDGTVKEILAAGGYTTVNTVASGFSGPAGLAVDASGNVYVADARNNAVKKIVATDGTIETLGSGFKNPFGVAVDSTGNVFVGDASNARVEKLDFADPPSLSFAATNVGSVSTDSPQSVSTENIGNATLSALPPGLLIGTNFLQVTGSGTPADCSATFSLAPSASCNLSISFKPTVTGPIQSAATLTDNAFNQNPATQVITLLGTGNIQTQTITFTLPASEPALNSLALNASASSGLPVSYLSSTPAVCMVSGATARFLTAGQCNIVASQAGNANYAPSTPVAASTNVTLISQTINFKAIGTQTAGTTATLSATSTSNGTVTFTSTTPTVCTTAGNVASFLIAGSCTITASVPATAVYTSATTSQMLTVNLAQPTLTFPAIGTQTAGTSVTLSATTSSNGTLTFASTTPTVCTVSGKVASFLTSGTCTLTASVAATPADASASVSQSVTVNARAQSITFTLPGTALQGTPLTLTASATSGLPVTFTSLTPAICTVSGNTSTLVSAGTCTIQASQAGNNVYAAASLSRSVTVIAAFTITPDPPSETLYRGDIAAFLLQLQAASGFSANVTLTCSSQVSGSYCVDFPMTLSFHQGKALALSGIFFPPNTPPGTYTITFTGTSGTIKNSATATFTVRAKP